MRAVAEGLLLIEQRGGVGTMRAVAGKVGRKPSSALMRHLWELCERNGAIATPHQHRGACPVRWTFELTSDGRRYAATGKMSRAMRAGLIVK